MIVIVTYDYLSVLFGMVFAYGLQVAKNFQLIDDSSDKTLTLLPCGGLKVRAYDRFMNVPGDTDISWT